MEWYRKGFKEGKRNRDTILLYIQQIGKELQKKMGGISFQGVKEKMASIYRQRLEAVPPLEKYPELKGVRERIIETDKGIMDAVGIDFGELSIYRNYRFYFERVENPGPKYKGKDCTIVYFADSSDGAILGKNVDDRKSLALKKVPDFSDEPEKKFIIDGVSSGIFYDEIPPEIFPVPVFELLEENCSDLKGAVEFLSRYKFFWGQGSYVLIDKKRKEGVIFEKSNCRYAIREMKYGALWCTAMTFAEEKMKKYLDRKRKERVKKKGEKWGESIEAEYWSGCDKRYKNLEKLVLEKKDRFSLKAMLEILHNHSPFPECICLHGQGRTNEEFPETNYTILTRIWLMDKKKVGFYLLTEKNFACEAKPVWKKVK